MSGYLTVAKRSQAEITEKRSRFIATVVPVKCEEEAIKFLNEIKKEYADARHNVYAYNLRENNTARYSDDGEPAQTAGLPVMDLLKKLGMTDCLVVVTRYFGGILLGTGGLVHAYTKAAKEGIISAEPVKMMLCQRVLINIDYTLLGKVQSFILSKGYSSKEPEYSEEVLIPVSIPEAEVEDFCAQMVDLTNAKAKITLSDLKYEKVSAKID